MTLTRVTNERVLSVTVGDLFQTVQISSLQFMCCEQAFKVQWQVTDQHRRRRRLGSVGAAPIE